MVGSRKKERKKQGILNQFWLKFKVRENVKYFELQHAVNILFTILWFVYKRSLMKLT